MRNIFTPTMTRERKKWLAADDERSVESDTVNIINNLNPL